jgi:polyferredoxin
VLAGVMGGVVVHYLVAKIVGPLFIGRAFCGWGCWIAMVLDLLPWKRGAHRRLGAWPWLRVGHFALSFALVAVLALGLGYEMGFEWGHTDAVWWFLGGTSLYLGLGVLLAVLRRDNRSFCKLLCPVTVFHRNTGRFSLLKVGGDARRCTDCGACDTLCPMDVPVSRYILRGTRVLDTECVLCQTCVATCPTKCLGLSLGFDVSRGRPPPLETSPRAGRRAPAAEQGARANPPTERAHLPRPS